MKYDILNYDFERNCKSYEYTMLASKKCMNLVYNDDVNVNDEEWAKGVFRYLLDEMEIIVFSDFLKRYVYEHVMMEKEFRKVTNEEFKEIILASFKERKAPFSFKETTKRPSAFVNGWLKGTTVSRKTLFALGFGLNMSESDVSNFLVKALKESNFDFLDPEEVCYWYCYRFHLKYPRAEKYLDYYDSLEKADLVVKESPDWEEIIKREDFRERKEEYLKNYLCYLKYLQENKVVQTKAYREFLRLYQQAREIIAENMNLDAEQKRCYTAEDISDFQMENEIFCGIPREDGNFVSMSMSLLADIFQNYRISRQRFSGLKKRKTRVSRFDLITLEFFVYCQIMPDEDKVYHYYRGFLQEMNHILTTCGMDVMYPVNPYESFILLCLFSEDPIDTFSKVWNLSYNNIDSQA